MYRVEQHHPSLDLSGTPGTPDTSDTPGTPESPGTPSTQGGGRGVFQGVVQFNKPLCREHFLLRLSVVGDFPPTRPGQFVQLGCRPPVGNSHHATGGVGDTTHDWSGVDRITVTNPDLIAHVAMLRRPFSLAGRGDDDRGTWIDLIHRVVGVGTAWMGGLSPGDAVDLIGPLGNWFTSPQGQQTAILVGGGVGLPPMLYLAQWLQRRGVHGVAFVGATTADLLAVGISSTTPPDAQGRPTGCVEQFNQYRFPTVVTTDDGSCGLAGRITDGLSVYLKSDSGIDPTRTIIYTCGPEPMMRTAARLAEQYGIPCQVCVEQAMACGMGTCQSCVVRIEDERNPQDTTAQGRPWRYRLTCSDGPIFDATQIVW